MTGQTRAQFTRTSSSQDKFTVKTGLISQSPASDAGKVSEPRLMSSQECAQSRMRVDRCVSVARAVSVPAFIFLRSSCSHMAEVGGP